MSNTSALGSGIDVNAMVSALMDVEKIPRARLDKTKSDYELQLKNYTLLSNLLTKFTDATDALGALLTTQSFMASSSDEHSFSVGVSGQVLSPGIYNIEITQLATAHQLASTAFASKDSPLGVDWELSIATGNDSFSLNIGSGDTLEDIRDYINQSPSNKGVDASILATTAVDGSPEFRLILISKETGVAQRMTVSGDTLNVLDLTHQLSSANDAQFTFDGFNVVRSSNTISDLLDGVTLTLNGQNNSAILTISPDNVNKVDNVKKGLASVVDAYNALIDLIDKNQSTKLLRDNTYTLIKSTLRNTMEQSFGSGSIKKWLDLGVKTAPSAKLFNDENVEYVSTGKYVLDDAIGSAVIADEYQSMSDFFTSSDGFIKKMQGVVDNLGLAGGPILTRENNITNQESIVDQRIVREDARLENTKKNLMKQYSALDLFIQHYQQIGNFLEQQIDSLKSFRPR